MMTGIWSGSLLTGLHIGMAGQLIDWLTIWVDVTSHGNTQAGVPFIFLGLLAGYWLIITHKCASWWLALWLALVGMVTVTEIDHTIRSNRHFNWGDVSWGGVAALISMAIMGIIALLIRSRERSV